MNKICGIYKITSPSKKVYIGQSVDILHRFRYYKRIECKKQTFLFHSLKKYDPDNHKFEIIHVCEPNQLNDLEIYYIELYSCFSSKYGLNLRTGGSNGKLSEHAKEKLRKKATGRKISPETLDKMCKAQQNRPPMSKEARINHSLAAIGKNKGKKHTSETKEKIRQTILKRNIKPSKDFIERLRLRSLGNKWNVGKHHSEDTINKMKLSAQKRRKHPSLTSYNRYGCRCSECRKIGAEYRLRKKLELYKSIKPY